MHPIVSLVVGVIFDGTDDEYRGLTRLAKGPKQLAEQPVQKIAAMLGIDWEATEH